MELREYKNTDNKSVLKLISIIIGDECKTEISEDLLKQYLKNDKYFIYILSEKELVQGFSVINTDPFDGGNNIAEIVFLAVQGNSRGKGNGRFIVDHLEKKMKDLKFRKLCLTVNISNAPAICFWIKMKYSFEARLKDFGAIGTDAYYLGKELF